MKKINLRIITPEGLVLEEIVDQVSLPTINGEITILPEHIKLIAGLSSGEIVFLNNSEYTPIALVGGFVEVNKDKKNITTVNILADFAEHVSKISEDEIQKAKARAEELKKQMENKDLVSYEHFATELERSLVKYKVAQKWKSKKHVSTSIAQQ